VSSTIAVPEISGLVIVDVNTTLHCAGPLATDVSPSGRPGYYTAARSMFARLASARLSIDKFCARDISY
jgi:hypothetical protein